MQMTEENEAAKCQGRLDRMRDPLAALGLLQIGGGLLCVLFQVRLYSRGLLGRSHGLDIMVYISPLFLAIGILDILLAIPVLMRYPYVLYPEFLISIALSLAIAWFPIGALFVYDVPLSYFGIGVSVLSVIHLAVLLWWKLGAVRE
jgi:hypothetical protein